MTQQQFCAWCGSEIGGERDDRSNLCPDCQEVYDTEAHGSLHPAGERQPYQE